MSLDFQNSVSIHPRTDLPKFGVPMYRYTGTSTACTGISYTKARALGTRDTECRTARAVRTRIPPSQPRGNVFVLPPVFRTLPAHNHIMDHVRSNRFDSTFYSLHRSRGPRSVILETPFQTSPPCPNRPARCLFV